MFGARHRRPGSMRWASATRSSRRSRTCGSRHRTARCAIAFPGSLRWRSTTVISASFCTRRAARGSRQPRSTVAHLADAAAEEPIGVLTDRGVLQAPLVVDAMGWRRVLSRSGYRHLRRRRCRGASRFIRMLRARISTSGSSDRSCGGDMAGGAPAAGEARVGVASYVPGDHVRRPTVKLAERLALEPVRYQGNWFPHRLRPAGEDSVFFVGDSAGHCFPLSGEGIRTVFYFGIACGRELKGVLGRRRSRVEALERYASFSAGHARAFAIAARLQQMVPPTVLALACRASAARASVADRPQLRLVPRSSDPSFAAPEGPVG